MTRPSITASWALSPRLVAVALLACTPPGPGPEPEAPTAAAPPSGLGASEAPGDGEGQAPATFEASAGAAAPAASAEAAVDPSAGAPSASSSPASDPAAEERPASGERMIEFFEIGRGDRVADLGGTAGYWLGPVRRAVGPAGVVFVRRSSPAPAEPAEPAEPTGPNGPGELGKIVWMNTPDEAPLVAEATRLNAVTFLFGYHAVVAAGRDRRKLHGAVRRALVPGGLYVIAEHAAPPGSGLAAARELGGIEDGIVRAEVQAAGFELVEAADFVSSAVATEARSPMGQYVLKFRKPK